MTDRPSATRRYTFKTKPYPHQRRALRRLLRQGGGGLQVPMRWGKTKVAIDFANCLHLTRGVTRVLVVCPLSVVGVWESEIPKHTPDDMLGKIEWRIVNYENVYARLNTGGRSWAAVPNKDLRRYRAELVVVDESHRIGNPTTIASRELYQLGKLAQHRVIMTGTMFHRAPFFVFGQAKFYDATLFGGAFGAFKKRIAILGGASGHEVQRWIGLRWMMRRMRRFVHIEKYVPGRPPVVNTLYFPLTGRGLTTYRTMVKEDMVTVAGEDVTAPIILTRHLRCQQIAGGWLKTPTGKYRRVGDDLLKIAKERFREYAEQDISKVVVGVKFLPELQDAQRAARAAGFHTLLFHGGMDRHARDARIRAFQLTRKPVMFIAQVDAGSMGIDLSAASVMCLYSLTESYVSHDQFIRRIEKYQETRTLMYDYLIPRGTRTEVTFESLRMKEDVAKFIVSRPRLVERITSKLGH